MAPSFAADSLLVRATDLLLPCMSETASVAIPTPPEPLSARITSIQPGGGVGYRLELAWGHWRRWYLRKFRPAYVASMARKRHGSDAGAPHAVLDPRDLKYCRNQCTVSWDAGDDPFAWRSRLPMARWGLAELQLFGWPLLVLVVLAWRWEPWTSVVPGTLLALVVWFFRDPPRRVPGGPGLVVAPADGKVVEIVPVEHDEFVGGPAVRIGIFLSIFNVHVNRAPLACRVIRLEYEPGRFLNALDPSSALENENMRIGVEEDHAPYRRLVVRQIAGAIARRIVCDLRPGERVDRGQKIGMIKFGSRTELLLPRCDGLVVEARLGQRLRGGRDVVARFGADNLENSP